MVEPGKQAMATALLNVSCRIQDVAMNCRRSGYKVSEAVLCDVYDRLDNVWPRYNKEYQEALRCFYIVECDDE
jgi:hypothetical protein